jgi:hypothetical protein
MQGQTVVADAVDPRISLTLPALHRKMDR